MMTAPQTISSSLQGNVLSFVVKGKTPPHHSDVGVEASIPVPASLQFESGYQMPGFMKAKLVRDMPDPKAALPATASPLDEYGFHLRKQLPADLTGDGVVDGADLGEALAGGDGALIGAVLGAWDNEAPSVAAIWGGFMNGPGVYTGGCQPTFMTTEDHTGPVIMRMGWAISPDTEYTFWGSVALPLLTTDPEPSDPPVYATETAESSPPAG